jgi:hypothetical protein
VNQINISDTVRAGALRLITSQLESGPLDVLATYP